MRFGVSNPKASESSDLYGPSEYLSPTPWKGMKRGDITGNGRNGVGKKEEARRTGENLESITSDGSTLPLYIYYPLCFE